MVVRYQAQGTRLTTLERNAAPDSHTPAHREDAVSSKWTGLVETTPLKVSTHSRKQTAVRPWPQPAVSALTALRHLAPRRDVSRSRACDGLVNHHLHLDTAIVGSSFRRFVRCNRVRYAHCSRSQQVTRRNIAALQ